MTDQPNLDPISAMISDPFNPRNPTPPPVGPHPEFPVTRAEKAATSKTFNTLDLRIDQAIDKTWMAKEELERLVEKKVAGLSAADATDLQTHLEAASAGLLAARQLVWTAAENA